MNLIETHNNKIMYYRKYFDLWNKSEIDPYKITTVTTFADRSSYENFVKGVEQRNAQRAKDGAPSLFRGEKLEGYEVLANI